MLESLHVKNLALIDEAEVEFKKGLNILTGETGAGKSIIIGSVNLALGAKADKDYIRTGAEYALIELVFSLNEEQKKRIEELEFPIEDDTLILQRKLMQGRSICRVNGESVSMGQLRQLSGVLLDMCGQHEHQQLLGKEKPAQLLDAFAGKELAELKDNLKKSYREYRQLQKELSENALDEQTRKREMDLLSFEVNEIEEAALIPEEEEELEKSYRKMSSARQLQETAGLVYGITGYEEDGSAGELIGRAVRELKNVIMLDEEAGILADQLLEIDNLLNDFNRSMADYQESLTFDEEEYARIRDRLDLINHLKGKYGQTVEAVLQELEEKKKRLMQLSDYEEYYRQLSGKLAEEKEKLLQYCKAVSGIRKAEAEELSKKLAEAMRDLNFLNVDFAVTVISDEEYLSEQGYDRTEFLISTNPGEAKKPLSQVASGGELSRIMLAFKSVFADTEETPTLVFDEIDAGISGKTAWKVSEKLGQLSREHQIICITHLPQIAAMEDVHFLIEKQIEGERTVTRIRELKEEESALELARLLGGGEVTEAVMTNAREMKQMALKSKN